MLYPLKLRTIRLSTILASGNISDGNENTVGISAPACSALSTMVRQQNNLSTHQHR